MLEIWGEAVRFGRREVKPTQRDQWLRPITFVGYEGSRIRLRGPHRYQKVAKTHYHSRRFLSDLKAAHKDSFFRDIEVVEELATQEGSPEGSLAPFGFLRQG